MEIKKYLIPSFTVLLTIGFVFVFTNVFIYLVISSILALLGMPILNFFTKIKIGGFGINKSVASLITLGVFFILIYIITITFIPAFILQLNFLSNTNLNDLYHNLNFYYPVLSHYTIYFGTEEQIINGINEQLANFLNFKNISFLFNNTLSFASSLLGGIFSILFITFFFLKDRKIIVNFILLITPSVYQTEMLDVFRTSKKMLSQYFIGLFLDITFMIITVTSLLWIFGIENALVIGCLAGIMNLIPYIGPIITLAFAAILGITDCIELNHYELIVPTLTKIIIILIGTNLVDAFIVQPTIFSNSVKAHPLEIFLIILMAAALGGVLGMVVAIPTYTLLRIIAKEFFSHLKFFKKITENIPE
jgi:predicted PurR-regulated permease PerM